MRKLLLTMMLAAAAVIPTPTRAHVEVGIQLGFPVVLPPLVTVEPGVMVVRDFNEEVFFVGGLYYVRRGGVWYRTADTRGRWFPVGPRFVPARIARIPPGRYRHWRGGERHEWHAERRGGDHGRHGGRD